MEKTRVKKGKPYYWIMSSSKCGFLSVYHEEMNLVSDNDRWESGNYFNSRKDADAIAKKLNAVLKGAEVIEMPSKEELTEKIFSTAGEIVGRDREITVSDCMKTAKSVVEWLIDKIVK